MVRIEFIAVRFSNSSELAAKSRPSIEFFVVLMARSNIAIITGKLNTAMSTLLLFAFEAIPEIRLNAAEKPHEVNNSVIIKVKLLPTTLPIKSVNSI